MFIFIYKVTIVYNKSYYIHEKIGFGIFMGRSYGFDIDQSFHRHFKISLITENEYIENY